jgi:hypothetical protein
MGSYVKNSERFDALLKEMQEERLTLIKDLRSYYIDIRDGQINDLVRVRSKRRTRFYYVSISNEFLQRIQNLNSIFSQFKVVGPGIVEYGSKKKGNYRVCKVGEKDYFKNAIWIHLSLIQEILYGIWPSQNQISAEFNKYKKLLNEFKQLSYEIKK